MNQVEEIKLLNPKEVSQETGVGLNTVYEWFRRKDFPKVPDDRINRISKRALNFGWWRLITTKSLEKQLKKKSKKILEDNIKK